MMFRLTLRLLSFALAIASERSHEKFDFDMKKAGATFTSRLLFVVF